MQHPLLRLGLLISIFCLLPTPTALAQSSSNTGALEGLVKDETTDIGIPGAIVKIVNTLTLTETFERTDGNGRYIFQYIRAGRYDISASADGYDATVNSEQKAYPVTFRQTTSVQPPPLRLHKRGVPALATAPTGPITNVAQVVRSVNLQDASRGLNVDTDVIKALPLAGMRSFDQLALLASGVAPPPQTVGATTGPGIGAGVGTSGQFAVNGLRSRGNNFTVDGSDNNDEDIGVRRQGFTALVPQPIETVQQFNIGTLLSRPQYGRNLAGQVDVVSHYGGVAFHGAIHGFYTDRRLKARDAFDLTTKNAPAVFDLNRCPDGRQFCDGGTPISLISFDASGRQITTPIRRANPVAGEDPFTRGQFGGILSGPLSRRKTFFLASYEHRLLHASRESNFAVPTVAERGLFNNGDRGLTVTTSDGVRRAHPTSAKGDSFFSLFPFPNNLRGPYADNTYTQSLPADARGEIGSFRVDQSFPLKNRQQTFAARYNITDEDTTLPVTGEALFSTMRAIVRTHNLALTLSGALNERTAQTLRFSYGRTHLDFAEVRGPFSDFLLPSKLKPGGQYVPFLLNAPLLANATLPGELPAYLLFGGDDAEGDIGTGTGTGPIGQVIVSGYSPLGVDAFNFPQSRADNTFQIAQTVSHTFLRHSVAGGADFRRVQINSGLDRNFRPVALFGGALDISQRFGTNNVFLPNTNGLFRGTDFAAAGAPTGFLQTQAFVPDSTIGLRIWQGNVFAEDQLNLAPNFKLTLGIRYELNSVPREVNNRIENTFKSQDVLDFISAEKTFGVSGFEKYLAGRATIFNADRNNVAPHVAFAWDPLGTGRTAIRGGYGIYYDQIPGAVVSQSRSVFPTFLTINLAGVRDPSAPTTLIAFNPSRQALSGTLNTVNTTSSALGSTATQILLNFIRLATQGNANSGRDNFPGGAGFVLPIADLVTPYAQHWSLTIEREMTTGLLASLAYVGTRGVHLLRFATPNLGVNALPIVTGGIVSGSEVNLTGFLVSPGTGATQGTVFRRPFPLLGSFTSIESDANSTYHSLQAEASMRLSATFKFTAAYTWAHAIDEVSDFFDLAGARALPQDNFDRRSERGDANFDVRHRFAGSFVWDLPWLRQNTALGGWQLAGIVTLQTGQPFTVNSSVDVNLDGNLTDRLNSSSGLTAVNKGSMRYQFPTTIEGQRALIAAAGANGVIGRNTLHAPGLANVDMAANKFFHFTETQGLEFRTEVFNLFNRTHFGIPAHVLFAPALGRSVNTTVQARTVQFALRYRF